MPYDWDNLVPVSDETRRQADWWINLYTRRLEKLRARGEDSDVTRADETMLRRWIIIKLTGMGPSWNTSDTETKSISATTHGSLSS